MPLTELGAASEQQQGVQTLLNEDNYPHRFNAKPKYGVKVFLIVLDALKALQRFWAFCCDIVFRSISRDIVNIFPGIHLDCHICLL